MWKIAPALLLIACAAGSAFAHHRQTAPVVQFTSSSDNDDLPRVPSFTGYLALPIPVAGTHEIVRFVFPYPTRNLVVSATGDNSRPVVSLNGDVLAWDSDAAPPGRQIFLSSKGTITQVAHDPTGTSVNPALSGNGALLAFESNGDLANAGNAGTTQIFLRLLDGTLTQLSRGNGTSHNPTLNRLGRTVAFDSTSHPTGGFDTTVAQIWVTQLSGPVVGQANPITVGQGASRRPAVSSDGRLVVFESTADLAGTGADTGVSQIFVFDVRTGAFARITDDAGGCTAPTIHKYRHDWRIPFMCGGQPYFYLLRADQRFLVPIGAGDTTAITTGPGFQFLMVSTTANLLTGSGTTAGHQLYLINLFKRPAVMVSDTAATWFPFRGLPAAR